MDTRKTILEAAERLIRENGVSRLTTKQVAQTAGVAEGTLFNHFGNKDNLILAVIEERAPQNLASVLLEQGPQFLRAIGTPGEHSVQENLARIAYSVVQFYEGVLPVLVSVFCDAGLLARYQAAERERDGGPQFMLNVIEEHIRAEQNLGRINPNVRAAMVASSLVGPCFQWVFVRHSMGKSLMPHLSEQEFVNELAAYLYQGLAPRFDVNGSSDRKRR